MGRTLDRQRERDDDEGRETSASQSSQRHAASVACVGCCKPKKQGFECSVFSLFGWSASGRTWTVVAGCGSLVRSGRSTNNFLSWGPPSPIIIQGPMLGWLAHAIFSSCNARRRHTHTFSSLSRSRVSFISFWLDRDRTGMPRQGQGQEPDKASRRHGKTGNATT